MRLLRNIKANNYNITEIIRMNDYTGLIFSFLFIGVSLYILIKAISSKEEYNYEYIEMGINEINIAKILVSFIKLKEINIYERNKILLESFKTYSEKLFVEISYKKIDMLIDNYSEKKINIEETCKKVSKLSTKHRLFVLYSLMDIAASDKIYSVKEEEYINNVRKMIKIPIQTFHIIKASYTKKGMRDERKIIEEQNRKKATESFSKSFLPYNAYKILGVSPSVTKSQLKKAYRTLAKKYHPDKFYGQSDDIIQKAEEKFQEITEAYEIVLEFKNY